MRTLDLCVEGYREASRELADAIAAFARPNPPALDRVRHLRAVRDAWATDLRAMLAQRGNQRATVQPT